MAFNHTDETDARIKQAYANRERIEDVAKELGTTRNVLIGRANRMKLGKKHQGSSAPVHNGGSLWTDQEIETLRQMLADGKRTGAIVAAMGRSRKGIRAKAKALGLETNGYKGAWSPSEDRFLTKEYPNTEDVNELARSMGRTKSSLVFRAYHLGITRRQNTSSQREWTEQEDEVLLDMLDRGVNASLIAEKLGRSRDSILGRCRNQGYTMSASVRAGLDTKCNIHPHPTHSNVPKYADEFGDISRFPQIPFLESDAFHCRFPLWRSDETLPASQKMCCGREIEQGKVYCEEHLKRCTRSKVEA